MRWTRRDPSLDAARYALERERADEDALGETPGVDVASRAADQEERERAERLAERRRRDRAATQHLWVERRIVEAQERGDFDDLPLAGKPIPGLTSNDPDWWTRGLVEREQLSDLAPESVLLRREDAALDARLDALWDEPSVREVLEDFNARVLTARCRPADGPPLVTPLRDVDREVARWRERRLR
ncbi:DUF1992 domain-containing protein [Demequina sp. SYSU T00192]|uniref:DUF1992 domain-containing protein n=1 Tax=Demequina litoralis TaxID=3051660 RepID=A0ABT8GA43_9MICO|nr:DUF1992 domain-containing protein [Demequina sp. SYSU T00192]MDN4475997.1 DUF1992 domain-containing protein [Demequina sp. SYSU T00192]